MGSALDRVAGEAGIPWVAAIHGDVLRPAGVGQAGDVADWIGGLKRSCVLWLLIGLDFAEQVAAFFAVLPRAGVATVVQQDSGRERAEAWYPDAVEGDHGRPAGP